MSSWTKEPWRHVPKDNVIVTAEAGMFLEWQARSLNVSTAERDANGTRIVQCVNALAGIDDPRAAIEGALHALRLVESEEFGTELTRGTRAAVRTALALLAPGESDG